MLPCLHHCRDTVVGKKVAHCPLNLTPYSGVRIPSQRSNTSFEVLEETILERAKSEFGDGIEIVERLHAAKINRGKLPPLVQGAC